MLMEEEQVLDPHQGSTLSHTAKEAIDDARSQVRVKGGGDCRPDACAYHDTLKEEDDRQAPEETRQGDDEQPTCPNGEEVANHSALCRGLRQMPLTVTC